MTYGLIEGDAIARRAVAHEGLATIPTPFGRYGALPALALVPALAPAAVALTPEALGILASMGLAGAAISMTRPSSVSAIGPFESTPNWQQDSKAWSIEMDNLSKAFRKNKGGGGGIGDDCAWMLNAKTIMAKVAQEANKIALRSGRLPQDSASAISKILGNAQASWISTMSSSPTWWSKALKLVGAAPNINLSTLSPAQLKAGAHALAIVLPMEAAGSTDYSSYFREATINVGRELARCLKTLKKSLGRYLADAFGKAFGAVIYAVSRLLTKSGSALMTSAQFFTGWAKPIIAGIVLEAIGDYAKDNKMDDSILAKVWDLLDRTVRDAAGADPADESGEPVSWRMTVDRDY